MGGTAGVTLACGSSGPNTNLNIANNDATCYAGSSYTWDGGDVLVSFTIASSTLVELILSSGDPNIHMFLCTTNNSGSCIANDEFRIKKPLPAGTYYVMVDRRGFGGGDYILSWQSCQALPCIPTSDCSQDNYIRTVTLNSINTVAEVGCPVGVYPSSAYQSYSYNTTPAFAVQMGAASSFSIENGGEKYDLIWIDLNQDNDFDDAGELVYQSPSHETINSGTFTIPYNSPYVSPSAFTTKMRVSCAFTGFSTSSGCESPDFGETEDYMITVNPPNVGTVSLVTGCPGTTVQIPFQVSGQTPPAATYNVYTGTDIANISTFQGTYTGSPAQIVLPANTDTVSKTLYVAIYADFPSQSYTFANVLYANPRVVSVINGIRCGPGIATFGAIGAPNEAGALYRYYLSATGCCQVLSSSTRLTSFNIAGTTTAYVDYVSSNGCVSANRALVTVTINPSPAITGIAGAGLTYPGEPFTVVGTNLAGATDVKVNGISAGLPIGFSGTELLSRVPAGATSGTVAVSKAGCPDASFSSITVLSDGSSSKNWRWVRRAYSSGADKFVRVRTTVSGHSYEVGSFTGSVTMDGSGAVGGLQALTSAGGLDGLLTRHRKDGRLEWAVKFGGSGADEALGLATDKFNYAYVSGYFSGSMTITAQSGTPVTLISAGGTDMFVAKIHPNGYVVYAYRMGASGNDRAEGIDVAPDLRVYVAGSFVGTTAIGGISGTVIPLTSRGNSDAFLAKFTDIGTLYWAIQAGGTGNDFGYGAAADVSGGGYLMGSYEGTATFNSSLTGTTPISRTVVGGSDGFVLGVSITGQLSWVASMGGTTNENVRDVAADPRGTGLVAVGGFSGSATFGSLGALSATGFYDAFAVRLSNAGAFQWVQKAGGFGQDQAWGVRLDRSGNPVVAMSFSQTAGLFSTAASNKMYSYGGIDAAVVPLAAATGAPGIPEHITGTVGDDFAYSVDTAAAGGFTSGFVAAGSLAGNTQFRLLGPYATVGSSDAWVAHNTTSAASAREGLDEQLAENKTSAHAIQLWPNPASQTGFSLKLASAEGYTGAVSIQVFTVDGRLAYTGAFPAAYAAQGIALQVELAPGAYTVGVDAGKPYHAKLIVR